MKNRLIKTTHHILIVNGQTYHIIGYWHRVWYQAPFTQDWCGYELEMETELV